MVQVMPILWWICVWVSLFYYCKAENKNTVEGDFPWILDLCASLETHASSKSVESSRSVKCNKQVVQGFRFEQEKWLSIEQ